MNISFFKIVIAIFFDFFLGGDWGLGIGDWPIPNPQSPIPNPRKLKFLN